MRTVPLAFALFGLASGLAIAATPSSALKVEMQAIVAPASDILFAVGSEVDPENPDAAKVPDARWKEAAAAAQTLGRITVSLNGNASARPGAEWAGFVDQYAAIIGKAGKAAAAKDGAGLYAASNDLSEVCTGCHAKYMPQT